jgi:hypothetical protein
MPHFVVPFTAAFPDGGRLLLDGTNGARLRNDVIEWGAQSWVLEVFDRAERARRCDAPQFGKV